MARTAAKSKRYFLGFSGRGSEQRENSPLLHRKFELTISKGCAALCADAGRVPLIHCVDLCGPDFGREGLVSTVDEWRRVDERGRRRNGRAV